jgi:transposase
MGKKQVYSYETKLKAIEMKLAQVPTREVMEVCGVKNETQIYQWIKWFKDGELHRLEQPIGKQYSYGKGPYGEEMSEVEQLKLKNEVLEIQNTLLKKYIKSKRK